MVAGWLDGRQEILIEVKVSLMFSTIKAPHPIHKIHENGALIKCVGVG